MSDDDRPRKSWKEIDRQRDKGSQRREERGEGQRRTGPRSQQSYRHALDRLFESGKIAELVEQKAPGSTDKDGPGDESHIKQLAQIKKAVGRDEITHAVDAYLKQHELPDDLEILGQVLEHRQVRLQLEAMERIDRLLERQRPKRWRAMIGQLKLIRDVGDEEEMIQLASRLIERLEQLS